MTTECSRDGCDATAEANVEWTPIDGAIVYCDEHAAKAVEEFPVIAERVDTNV